LPYKNPYLDENRSLLAKTFDILTAPGSAVTGALRALQEGADPLNAAWENLSLQRKDTFSDVLGNIGMANDGWEGTARGALGFAGDVLLDPTTYFGGALVKGAAKGLGAGARATGLASLAGKVTDSPLFKGAKEALGNRFVVDYGAKFTPQTQDVYRQLGRTLPTGEAIGKESFRDLSRLVHGAQDYAFSSGLHDAADLAKGLRPLDYQRLAYVLDQGGTIQNNPALEDVRLALTHLLEGQGQKETAQGILNKWQQDYLPMVVKGKTGKDVRHRMLSGKNPHNLPRTIKDVEQWEAITGQPANAIEMVATRLAVGRKALVTDQFFDDVVKQFGVSAGEIKKMGGLGNMPGFRQVKLAGELPIKKTYQKYWFPEEIASTLEKLSDPKVPRDLLDTIFGTATALWKGYATRVNPGFHIRNLGSNVINSWLGGVNLADMPLLYKEAAEWGTKMHDIGPFAADEITRMLKVTGVEGGSHGAFDEMLKVTQKELQTGASVGDKVLYHSNPLNMQNVALKAGGTLGNFVEGTSRKALFLDQLYKMAPKVGAISDPVLRQASIQKAYQDAALHVKKYLFDYAELTPFEKNLRMAIPFYTWTRKNLPLQLEHLYKTPQKAAQLGKLQNALEKGAEAKGIQVPGEERPEYVTEQNMVQLPWLSTTGEALFANPSLPMADINRLGGGLSEIIASMNPALRVPIEIAANKEMFTGRPVHPEKTGWGGYVTAAPWARGLHDLAPDVAGVLGIEEMQKNGQLRAVQPAWQRYFSSQLPPLATLGKIASTGADIGEQGAIPGIHLPPGLATFLGVPVKSYSQQELARDKKYRVREAKAVATAKRKEKQAVSKSRVDALWETARGLV